MEATYSPDDNKLRLRADERLEEETYARVRDAGFRWAPRQRLFVAPSWSPEREDLLIDLCGEIGDEDTTLVERAEERAERFEGYGARRESEGQSAQQGAERIAEVMNGQPILVGHHSERRHRRDLDRMDRGMRRAHQMFQTARYWERRAAGALRTAKYRQHPGVRARRIKKLEAEVRRRERSYTPAEPRAEIMDRRIGSEEPELHVWCKSRSWVPVADLPAIEASQQRWLAHLRNRLVYERALLASDGKSHLLDKPKRAKLPPIRNYRADTVVVRNRFTGETETLSQVEVTKAQLARLHADYKGTSTSPDGSHRVRTAMRRALFGSGATGGRVAVFLSDSKVHPSAE